MKIVEKCPTMERFDRIVNRWKEQLMQCQTDTNELVFRLRDFVQTELDINRIKSNRWIPCSERLPEVYEKVLTYNDEGIIHDNFRLNLKDGSVGWSQGWGITHWQPRPEPPEKE